MKSWNDIIIHLFIFGTIQVFSAQLLYYEEFTSNTFTDSSDWQIIQGSGIYSDCGSTRLLGGYGNFGNSTKLVKLFELPPHYQIEISVQFWKIDTWDNERFFFYIDQELPFSQTYPSTGTQICGNTLGSEIIQTLNFNLSHSYHSALFFLTSNLNTDPTDESWGIRDFKLFLYLCPAGCVSCNAGDTQQQCQMWTTIFSSLLGISNDTFQHEGWVVNQGYNQITQCECVPMLGGIGKTGRFTKITQTIQLPPHSQLLIKFRYIFQESWDDEFGYMYIDNQQVWKFQYKCYARTIQNLCSLSYDEIFYNQQVIINHSKSNINIQFYSNLDESLNNEAFAIRDFELFIYCKFGEPNNPQCGEFCGNGIREGTEQCDDANIYSFDGCFNCQYSCQESCSNCINGQCFECKLGYNYDPISLSCFSICNDCILTMNEECDDSINRNNCKNCQFNCPQNCQHCLFGICLMCQNYFILIENRCEFICESNVIILTQDFQCLDNNLQNLDYCRICQQDVGIGCEIANQNICIKCYDGWIYDFINQICQPQCGNNKIEGNEQCEQITQDSFNSCYQCLLICQDECSNCVYGICQNCIPGWTLNESNQCIPTCGDGLILTQEICDDSNNIEKDGCYNCKNDCQNECTICVKGQCLDCIIQWELNQDWQCEFLQQNPCPNYCIDCEVGQCYKCQQGYNLDFIQNFCFIECGDEIVAIDSEQCDDGNTQNGDGCSQYCQIENNYLCFNYQSSFSECTFEIYPIFQANLEIINYDAQYVFLTFSQEVKSNISSAYINEIDLLLLNTSSNEYSITLSAIQEATNVIQNVQYQVIIYFNQQLTYKPKLQATLLQQLFNIHDANLQNLNNIVNLHIPFYSPNIQEQQSILSIKSTAEITIKMIGSMALLSFLFGNPYLSWGIIEMLQQQSYLRYINVIYPNNLLVFFETSNIISLDYFMDIFNFDFIANLINCDYYEKSYEKFLYYEINADLFSNLQTQVFLIFVIIITYIISSIIIIIIRNHKINDLTLLNIWINKLFLKIGCYFYNFKKGIRSQFNNLFDSNVWDLLFTCLLQNYDLTFLSDRQIIGFILSYYLIYLIIIISILNINKISYKQESFITYWNQKDRLIKIFHKLCFLSVLIKFQKNQYIQVILLNFFHQIYSFYQFFKRNTQTKLEFTKDCLQYIVVFLFLITTFLYLENSLFNYEQQFQLGWFHIYLLLLALIINLILSLYEILTSICQDIYKVLKKRIQFFNFGQQEKLQSNSQHKILQ